MNLFKITTIIFLLLLHTHHPLPRQDMNSQNSNYCLTIDQQLTEVNITDALQSFEPPKVPGPDGLHPYFYQKYWAQVKSQVIGFCKDIFNTKQIPQELNKTYLCLIPKTKQPSQITQYRPISLCNTLYKLITKIIVKQIKPLLMTIISPEQSTFLPNRRASDNAIIVQEIMHYFKNKKR